VKVETGKGKIKKISGVSSWTANKKSFNPWAKKKKLEGKGETKRCEEQGGGR